MPTPAFWLPAMPEVGSESWVREGGDGSVELLVPKLDPDLLRRQLIALEDAHRAGLAERPIAEIVEVVDLVARRFLDPHDPLRQEALELLPRVTGLSPAMAELTLSRMAADWTRPHLERLLEEELIDARVLDEFTDVGRSGRRVFAVGSDLVFHVFSGNVPGVAVTSLVRALLVKSSSIGKTASGEPVLPVLFARAIGEADRRLGDCLAIAYWRGGDEALEAMVMDRADSVIAYGSRTAIEEIRARLPPGKRFLEYGNRVSFAVIAREALTESGSADLAADAALAIATFDQQGCVSPHLIYVEQDGQVSPREWAVQLAEAMARIEERLPRGRIGASDAATIQQIRGRAEIAALTPGGSELHASADGTEWTVVFDPDPEFDPSCLNRLVRVKPIASLGDVPELVAPFGALLQTVGVAGSEDRLADLGLRLARLGVTRLAPLSTMPWPKPWWHHDGRPALGDLVRWCDWD